MALAAQSLVTDQHVVILDVDKLRKSGMSTQEFISLIQLGVYPSLDVYRILRKEDAVKELIEYSK